MNMQVMCWLTNSVMVALVSAFIPLAAQCATSDIPSAIRKALPGQVAMLASWPNEEQQTLTVVKPNASEWTIRASRNSLEWINTIVASQALPDNTTDALGSRLVLLKRGHDGLDTSHVEWERHGYLFRASQTKTIFYLSVTPLQGTIADGNGATMSTASRDLASKVVKDALEFKQPLQDGERGSTSDSTKAILLHACFEKAKIEQIDGGLVAFPAAIEPSNRLDRRRFNYWWRRMGWWTDGQTLGLFTLKTDGGAWRAGYDAQLDAHWLSPPPPK